MKICNNCGRQYTDDINFCGICGVQLTNLVEARICPTCQRNFGDQQISFCPYCGVGLVNQIPGSTVSAQNSTNNNYHTTWLSL